MPPYDSSVINFANSSVFASYGTANNNFWNPIVIKYNSLTSIARDEFFKKSDSLYTVYVNDTSKFGDWVLFNGFSSVSQFISLKNDVDSKLEIALGHSIFIGKTEAQKKDIFKQSVNYFSDNLGPDGFNPPNEDPSAPLSCRSERRSCYALANQTANEILDEHDAEAVLRWFITAIAGCDCDYLICKGRSC